MAQLRRNRCRVVRLLAVFLAVILAGLSACAGEPAAPLPEKISLYYFYDEPCGACDGTEDFYALFNEKMSEYRDMYPYEIIASNVFTGSGLEYFEEFTAERGLSTENISYPALVVGGKLYSGMEAIGNSIVEAFLTAGEDIFTNKYVYYPARDADKPLFERYGADKDRSTLVYFYRIVCEECKTVKPIVDGLPETVTVNGEQVGLDIIRFNSRSGNNDERVRAFFKAYGVPDEKQAVPVIFLADTYLSGYDEISSFLSEKLESGEGLGFEFPKDE